MKFLEHRIGDPRILRSIRKWLSIVREISVSFSERRTTVKDRLPLSKEWGCQRILRMGRIKEERREVRGRRRAACDESETEKIRFNDKSCARLWFEAETRPQIRLSKRGCSAHLTVKSAFNSRCKADLTARRTERDTNLLEDTTQ